MGAGKSSALDDVLDTDRLLADAYRDKFGGDHMDDVLAAHAAYRERIGWKR